MTTTEPPDSKPSLSPGVKAPSRTIMVLQITVTCVGRWHSILGHQQIYYFSLVGVLRRYNGVWKCSFQDCNLTSREQQIITDSVCEVSLS